MSNPANPDHHQQSQSPQEQPQPPSSADQDRSLSGFFDTLDERARTWWAERKTRREQARAQAVQQSAASAERLRTAETENSAAEAALPKPPPPEHRPEGQLFTGTVPVVAAAEQVTVSPPPPLAPELPALSSSAEQVPAPAKISFPPAERTFSSAAAKEPAGSAEAAAKLPADVLAGTPSPGADSQDQRPAELESTHLGGASAAPAAQPPRVRRALDEQRQRNVIVQKARAIEDATSSYVGYPYPEFADDEEDLYTYIPPYNLPSRDPDPKPTRWDLYRQIFVTVGALAALLSTAWMFGWFSTDPQNPAILGQNGLDEAYADGWYSGDHALLSPDHNFYWFWPVIAAALTAHAGFQWTAAQQSTPRQRRTGWYVGSAASLLLVLAASLHNGLFTLTLLVSLAMAGLLLDAIRQLNLYTARSQIERRLTDGIIGLFFGIALVQAMSAVSVWLTVHGWQIPGIPALLWAGIGLFICVWTAAFYAMTERGRINIALAMGWGMFWLIFPRLLAEVTSVWVAIGAAMGAFIVILSTQSRRHRINHAERRAAMGRPLEDII